MAAYKIYHKDGSVLKDSNGKEIAVHSIEYNGTWMGECFVAVTLENEAPIEFSIGDYVEYRNERFEINYDPGKIKCASKDSYGGAFKYDSVKFNALSDELARCDMLDLVLYDNKLHYTALPQFSFYVESLDDLLDRIQANLDELYGTASWKIYSRNRERSLQRGCLGSEWDSVYGEGTSDNTIDSTSISISDQTCWDALSLVNSQFDVNFIIRNRNVYVGTAGVPTTNVFKYGKGKGLYEIEQNSESDQMIVTRLRAYGSNRNLPNRYYADLGSIPFLNITGDYHESSTENGLSVMMEDSVYVGMFTDIVYNNDSNIKHCRIRGRIDGYEFDGKLELVKQDAIKSTTRLLVEEKASSDAVKAKIDSGMVQVDFLRGANKTKFDGNRLNYVSNLPNNMACDRLMLPGFPNKTLREWWDMQSEAKKAWLNPSGKNHIFSGEKYRPFVDSLNTGKIGVRPSSVFFDKDDKANGIVEIYPTIEGMEVEGVRVDEIHKGSNITDDGRFGDNVKNIPNFDIYLSPKINFDVSGLMQEDFTICMKDGMCAGREFKVAGCVKQEDNSWKLTVERALDNSLNLYFPYKDFQIKVGDHFVLTGIELPDAYVDAASEKLLKYCIAYLDKNDYTRYVYQPKVDEIFMARQHDTATADASGLTRSLYLTLKEGDIMLFKDEDLGIDAEITIDQLTIKEEDGKIPTYEVTLREEKEVGTIQKIQNQISSITGGNGGSFSGGTGDGYTTSQIRNLIYAIGSELFLSKTSDDTAAGIITFLQGLVSNGKITARQGVDFGTFIAGLYGSGGSIDSMGRTELHSLFVRTSISAPKFVFNLVNVTKAEQWNTNGFGTVKSVDKENRICELQLEDNEYGSLEVGDICRGIYADIDNAFGSDSNEEGATDECGFTVHQGFFTTYFYVEKVLKSGKGVFRFRYGKRSEATPDPCPFMDFAQYGNFVNEERQASTYFSSRGNSYIEELGGVKTWEIQSENRVVRLGWLGNLQVKKKNGSWVQLKGNGLFVQDNIYFGGQPNFLDGLAELDDLKELATSYEVTLSQYQSVITVDDMGNVINGLYTEDEAKTTKQYRISTAVFVRKGSEILLEEDAENENVTEGHYRLHVVSDDCDVEVRNSTFFVKSIKNIKDGVSGTEDDATFDYDAMRKMTDAMVLVVVDLEGKTTKSVEMPIHIQHDSLPFMVCDITNENASVAWNTKTKKYIGLPIKATVNLMYHNEPWLISECKVVGGVPEGLTATVALNENGKSYDITIDGNPADDTLPQVSNIVITVVGRYAGANYEYTKTLTINKSADNVIYEIVPSADSIVIDKADNMTANVLTCDIYATSSDDKRYKLDTLPGGFTLEYGIDTDVPTTAMQINDTVNVSSGNKQVVFALYDKSRNVLDKESVPVLAYGKDGKGIEYVFKQTTNDEIPDISTPTDWATNTEYQRQDKEYVPTGWTDNPVGVNEEYLYEWVATRKSVNGVWQPFGDVSEYAHFGKHAARATVTDSIVTIPTDSSGNALDDFSEDIHFSLLVDGLACSIDSISTPDSLDSASFEINKDDRRVTISCDKNAALGKSAQTLNFKVVGTLNGAAYQDSVTVKVIPNATGEDGDGYEYVYYLSATEQTSLEAPSRNGGNLTSGWTEDVPVLTETQRYVYVAWKRGEVGADGPFSLPKLFTYKAKDGVGISSVTEYYLASALSSGVTVSTSGWTTTIQSVTATKKYLWNYEKITYSNGTTSTTTPVIIGTYGDKGVGISSITEHYLATSASSGVTTSTSGWTTSIQTVTNTKKYLWNYETVTYTDGRTVNTDPVIIGVYGDKGDPGRGVTSVNTFYALHTSLSAKPSDGAFTYDSLSGVVISSNADSYVWSADKVTYSEGDPEFTGKYCIGKCSDLTSVSEQYGTSSSATSKPTTWSDTYPQDIPGGSYIWTRDKITWKDGSVTYSAAQLSGQIPVGISSIVNYYNVTATSTTAPKEWKPNSPAVTDENPFLWRKMVITYTNGSIKTDISLIGAKGEKGVDGTSVEYIYKLSKTESAPDTPSTSQVDDYVPTGWDDDPQGVTSTNKYEYVSSRIKTNGVWSAFSTPSLWAKYSEDGNSVSDIKNYYRANTSPTAAPTSGWKASASESGFSSMNKYLWNYEEVFYSKTGSTKTTPRVIAVWGEKGNTGVSVAGIEEQYALSTSNTNVTGSWSSSIPTLTPTNKYLWNRERTKFDDGSYSAWSTPVIIGVYGDKGVGEVTAYCRSAIAPTIVPTVTSRDVFVNANPSANLGASLTHSDPANGTTIITDGWDSIKSAATLNSFWRKAIPDAVEVNNVMANRDNFSYLAVKSNNVYTYSDHEAAYWNSVTLDGHGWWKSSEPDSNIWHMMKIEFTTTQANQVVTFVMRSSSEAGYDYGVIGKLDSELTFNTNGIGNYTAKVSGSNEIYIPILVPIADNHHIWVAYTKDGSGSPAPDCCYVRIATDELHQIKGIADGETIKWETISEIKATKGDTGYGCVMRTSLWAAGKEYVNQSNEEGDGVKYIDIVYVEDSSANEGYRLYECRMTHTSSTTLTYNDTNHWREIPDVGPIYTPLIVAKNAVFKFAQGQQFNIADGDTVWGSFRHVSNSDDLALWLGASVGNQAPFGVTAGGKLKATDAEITGVITATSGSITGNMNVTGSLTVGTGSTALYIKQENNYGKIVDASGNGLYFDSNNNLTLVSKGDLQATRFSFSDGFGESYISGNCISIKDTTFQNNLFRVHTNAANLGITLKGLSQNRAYVALYDVFVGSDEILRVKLSNS